MGIRIKLVLGLCAVMLLPLAASQAWMAWTLHRGYAQAEQTQAVQAMQRLLVAVDAQLQTHETLVNDWANWTDFAEYVRGRQPGFAQSNLTLEAVASAGFEWLAVIDRQGRLLLSVDGDPPSVQRVLGGAYGPQLHRPPAAGERSCGLARDAARWLVLCRQAIRDSTGTGESAGLLVVAEALRPDFVHHLKSLTGLDFELHDTPMAAPAGSTPTAVLSASLGRGAALMDVERTAIHLRWPVQDMAGQDAGHLALVWARTLSMQARDDLGTVVVQLIAFFVLLTVGLMVMLDRTVVQRLERFSAALRAIHQRESWGERIPVDGTDEISVLQRESNDLLGRIQHQVASLERLADTDPLTGLPNRRRFQRELARGMATALRHHRPMCLLVIDVDHFKAYNDHYGHLQGDTALKVVADSLRALSKRPGDLPARIGGEEFGAVLEDTTSAQAMTWAAALSAHLRSQGVAHARSPIDASLTVSIGVAEVREHDTQESLYRRADQALYQAKAGGRNRAVLSPD